MRLALILVAGFLAACDGEAPEEGRRSDLREGVEAAAGASAVDTPTLHQKPTALDSIRTRLGAFLDAARTEGATIPDSLIACEPEGAAERNLVLARYAVLSVERE